MKVQQLIKDTCAIAAEDLGKAKADQIAQAAQTRFEALCTENASDSKELRAHSFKRIYPGIAIYEALRVEGIPQEKAVWYIREYFQRFAAKRVPLSNGPSKRLALHASFLASLNQVSRKAAHQVLDLPLNIQKVTVTKRALTL